ncbi:hypothetical protein BSKO_11601 [Bryopsis sp. KO-2023]|nr:hypothetical protein BSKO_11601 [Bryopsis sp. KO-2023]
MPAGAGYRNKTRDLFSKKHRKHGMPTVGTYLRTFKLGEYVDIICDPAIQQGMPFKIYHGKIGRVWNVTKRAVGVEVNKRVRHRIFRKRLHVRVEHIRKSRCREDFLARVDEHDKLKKEAIKKGVPYVRPKRQPVGPKDGFTLQNALSEMETIAPIPYDILKEGLLSS